MWTIILTQTSRSLSLLCWQCDAASCIFVYLCISGNWMIGPDSAHFLFAQKYNFLNLCTCVFLATDFVHFCPSTALSYTEGKSNFPDPPPGRYCQLWVALLDQRCPHKLCMHVTLRKLDCNTGWSLPSSAVLCCSSDVNHVASLEQSVFLRKLTKALQGISIPPK